MIKDTILIVGSFRHPKNKKHTTTAAEQLAALLETNKITVIKTSAQYKRFLKITDTLKTIIYRRKDFDIAVVPLYGTRLSFIWQETAARLLKSLGKKIILIVHGGSIPEQVTRGKTKFLKAMQRADLVVCPSAYFKEFLATRHIKCVVIENVLDLSAYTYHTKKKLRPHIMWMRSFENVYNPAMAVRVAKILAEKYPGFKMVMAGNDNGLLDKIKEMAAQYHLQDSINFPGYINIDDKNNLADEYDIYISTNTIDNAPVSLVEFMALGLPVISVNCGGVPFIIDEGVNGLLVTLNDDEAMADKIEMLLNTPGFGESIGSKAREYAKQYGYELILQKWLNAFEGLN